MKAEERVHAQSRQRSVSRFDVLVAVMLSRERRAPTEHADGCAPLAASLAALPSGLMELVAEAVAALGGADLPGGRDRTQASARPWSACVLS